MIQIETPKSSGTSSCPRRLSLTTGYRQYKRNSSTGTPMISSPLATSSPMVPFVASADRPLRRPPPKPKSTPISHVTITTNYDTTQWRPTSKNNTIRSTDLSSIFTTPEEAEFDVRHAELLQSIQAQRELVEQAAAAIAYCRKRYSYNGTLQELSAQRLLLISKERLIMFNRQMDELKDKRFATNVNFSSNLQDISENVNFEDEEMDDLPANSSIMMGMSSRAMFFSLFLDKLVLQLNPSFSMKKIDKDSTYAFVVLCRNTDCIHATQVANVLDIGELRNQKVKIKELIVFDDLRPDFCITVEIFAMKVSKRLDHKWQSLWDFAARTFRNIKRSLSSSFTFNPTTDHNNSNRNVKEIEAPGAGASFSASSVLTQQSTTLCSDFHRCGYLHLNRENLGLGKEKFYLSDADYPLEGSIEVYARFAANNAPMEPARPDSAEGEFRIGSNATASASAVDI